MAGGFGTPGRGQPNIQAPFGAMSGRAFGGGGMGYGGSQYYGGKKRPLLGGGDPLIGTERGQVQQPPGPSRPGGFFGAINDQFNPPPLPPVGGRNPLPNWPGDNPIANDEGGYGPRQFINYRGLPGFSGFQESFQPTIPGRRRIDMDPGQYGQGLQYKNPAMLQQLSDKTMAFRSYGRGAGRSGGMGQGFGEGYPGDALRRLLMARLGGGM